MRRRSPAYDTTLDRLADAPGLAAWIGALKGGMTLTQMADGFTGRPEFQTKYGALDDVASSSRCT